MSWRDDTDRGGFSRGGRGNRGNRNRGGYRGGYRTRLNRPPMTFHSHNGKRIKFDVTNRLKEVDVGITEFIGDHEHFTGIMKERYNDFHVHEIDLNGDVAKLTTQELPPDPEDLLDVETMRKSVCPEILKKIDSFTEANSNVVSVGIDVTDLDKDQRRVIHAIVKNIQSVYSQTIDKDDRKLMILDKAYDNRRRFGIKRNTRGQWLYRDGIYCKFLLHKVNMDTMDAINKMAMHLRMKPNLFTFAGTKDRRARTTQWICLKRAMPSDILDAGKSVRGAFVGNFKIVNEPLKLGNLNGNVFTIALRNVSATDEEIDKAMGSLRDNGFINYYGLQRFGTIANTPTHDIGKVFLQSKWEEAVYMILKPRSGDREDLAAARQIYDISKDAGAALKLLYHRDKIEAKLLKGLSVCAKNNYQGALDHIPRNIRLMYIHSYQSFIWNNIVSKRIKEFGLKPIVGDLVYERSDVEDEPVLDFAGEQHEDIEGHDKEDEKAEMNDKTEKVDDEIKKLPVDESDDTDAPAEKVKIDNEAEGQGDTEPAVNANAENNDEKMDETPASVVENKDKNDNGKNAAAHTNEPLKRQNLRPLPSVKILTEADLPNYTLADVVMPQPGNCVVYPPYAKPWYDEYLANDGLDADLQQKNKKYSLSGDYRKILQRPQQLSWKIMHYKSLDDDLIACDIDEMRKLEGPKDYPEGKYKALILEMTLKSSTYATMALREVLKHDTAADTQAAQSAAYHAQDAAETTEDTSKDNNGDNNDDDDKDKDKEKDNVETKIEVLDEISKDLPMEQESTDAGTDNETQEKNE